MAALPEIDETKTSWPEPRSTSLGTNSRVIRTGASRFTRSARPISSWLNPSRRPDAGRPALATSTSTSTGLGQQAQRRALLGQIANDASVNVAREPRCELGELVGLAAAEHEPRPAIRESVRDRDAEPPGGAGEQHRLAAEIHARNLYAAERMKLFICWGTFQTVGPAGIRAPTPTTRSRTPATTQRS